MTILNKKQVLSETRKIAAELGLTFKEQLSYINNQKAYKVIHRKSGKLLSSNMTLSMGYENGLCGYFYQLASDYEQYNKHIDY